jgi:hypothetical protein
MKNGHSLCSAMRMCALTQRQTLTRGKKNCVFTEDGNKYCCIGAQPGRAERCIASCIHVSDFLQTPPNEEHPRFPLYYAFASVMSSMVSGQESVGDPTSFINLFRENHENYDQGMSCL